MSKILVVDDDNKIAIALAARLRANGFEVVVAHDGMQAVMSAVKHHPDLIVMDINLPGGSGITAAGRIQNLADTAGVPIIFITASKDPKLRSAVDDVGGMFFLEKPFESDELLSMIKQSL